MNEDKYEATIEKMEQLYPRQMSARSAAGGTVRGAVCDYIRAGGPEGHAPLVRQAVRRLDATLDEGDVALILEAVGRLYGGAA